MSAPAPSSAQDQRQGSKYIPATYTPWVRCMAWAVVIANIVLIVSGGIVRLTGSGLGCDTWPKCTSDGSWTTTPEMGIHGIVEFGNRMLTFVLMAVTVLTFLSIIRIVFPQRVETGYFIKKMFTGLRANESRYSDLFNLTLLLGWGIPVQAVVGGISVWLKLNPWMITAHYLLSAIMIALAGIYLNRIYRYFEPKTAAAEALTAPEAPAGMGAVRALAWVGALVVFFLIFIGTVTTGTGPHAGDAQAIRHAFDPVLVTRLHGTSVWVYCASALILFAVVKRFGLAPAFTRSLTLALIVLAYQAIVGYTQYFNGLPVWLVEMHLLGSGLFTWAASSLIERQFTLSARSQRELALTRINH